MRRERRAIFGLVAVTFAGAVSTIPSRAFAQDKQACVAAYDRAQELRKEVKLKESQAQLMICAREVCPGVIRNDCSQWMGEVVSSLPSIVIGARDVKGRDLVAVRVSIDGAVVTEQLDGKAIPIDPGVHAVKYEDTSGALPPVEEKIVVREGEKNRVVAVTFTDGSAAAPSPNVATPAPDESPSHTTRRTVGFVAIGAGIVATGVGVFLGVKGNSDASNLRDTCGPTKTCTQDQVNAVQSKWAIGGVLDAVGGLAIVGGIVAVILSPSTSDAKPAPAASWNFDAAPLPHGGAFSFTSRF